MSRTGSLRPDPSYDFAFFEQFSFHFRQDRFVSMIDHHSLFLLLSALGSVVGPVPLFAVVRLNPFVSILVASIALVLATGMPLQTVVHSSGSGLDGTLEHIAVVVALSAMLSKTMAESGGADRIARTLSNHGQPARALFRHAHLR